jgi:hypothetical protein
MDILKMNRRIDVNLIAINLVEIMEVVYHQIIVNVILDTVAHHVILPVRLESMERIVETNVTVQTELNVILMTDHVIVRKASKELNVKIHAHQIHMEKSVRKYAVVKTEEFAITYQVNVTVKKVLLDLCAKKHVKMAKMVMSVNLFAAVKMVVYVMMI